MAAGQITYRFVTRACVTETNFQTVVVGLAHVNVRNIFITQIATQVVDVLLLEFPQSGIHIHFHQEVNATAQIETELHRFCGQHREPGWSSRGEVKRHYVILAKSLHNRFTRAQLHVGIRETRQNSAIFQGQ